MDPDVKTMSGKDYYERHKGNNCHINSKKYFQTLLMINDFLSKLKKTNKKPIDDAFKRGFRNLLKEKPTSKDPKEWKDWKNRVLQRLEIMSNLPEDLCELPPEPKKVEPKKDSKKESKKDSTLPQPHSSPPPFTPSDHPTRVKIELSEDAVVWKELLHPIIHKMDAQVTHMMDEITADKEIIMKLIPLKDDMYTYILTGGCAYRGLAFYIQQQLPFLPDLEEIAPKSHDYDINILVKDFSDFPTTAVFSHLVRFCETVNTMYYSTWNKIHSIPHKAYFIKPSPCLDTDREGISSYDYTYVQDRFLITTSTYAYKGEIKTIQFQITMCLQIETSTETYCSTDHILDLTFMKEEKVEFKEKYEIQSVPWYPFVEFPLILYNMANEKKTLHVSTAPIRIKVDKVTYQIPHPLLLFVQSANAMVQRGVLDSIKFYKARQDYVRIYTLLRMLQTLPHEDLITKDQISYVYTLLQSITMDPKWSSMSESEKKAQIQQYKTSDPVSLGMKLKRTAIIYDAHTKKHKTIELGTYYKGPYEEFRTEPKEMDPLLYELGEAKFKLRQSVLPDENKAHPKSCDGTTPVKRRTVKRTSKSRMTTRKANKSYK
jgi:hypothetical protein